MLQLGFGLVLVDVAKLYVQSENVLNKTFQWQMLRKENEENFALRV